MLAEIELVDVVTLLIVAANFFIVGTLLATWLRTSRTGPLPAPIRVLGVSYLLLQVAVIGELYGRLGDPFNFQTFLEGAAAVLGVVGVIWALRYYELGRRINRHFHMHDSAAWELVKHLTQLVEHGRHRRDDP